MGTMREGHMGKRMAKLKDGEIEFTIEFRHPCGPRAGLEALRALEKVLKKNGCRPFDHGTNFAPRKLKGRRVNAYLSSDVTAIGDRIPMKVIREAVYGDLGIPRFKMFTRTPELAQNAD